MNGATARNPATASAGSRCSQVCAVSGNPCRHRASGPAPAASTPNSRPFARTLPARTATEAATPSRYPATHGNEDADGAGRAEPVTGAGHPAVQRLQFLLSEARWITSASNDRRLELLL